MKGTSRSALRRARPLAVRLSATLFPALLLPAPLRLSRGVPGGADRHRRAERPGQPGARAGSPTTRSFWPPIRRTRAACSAAPWPSTRRATGPITIVYASSDGGKSWTSGAGDRGLRVQRAIPPAPSAEGGRGYYMALGFQARTESTGAGLSLGRRREDLVPAAAPARLSRSRPGVPDGGQHRRQVRRPGLHRMPRAGCGPSRGAARPPTSASSPPGTAVRLFWGPSSGPPWDAATSWGSATASSSPTAPWR